MLNFSLWALLPPAYSVFTAAGLWWGYFAAVRDEIIAPLGSKYGEENESLLPPYISVAGSLPPASCIFSELMNLSAFLALVIAVLRYLQLKRRLDGRCLSWLNLVSLVAFSVACFGMTLVGNFQLFIQKKVHNSGTYLTFGPGTLFCWVQSFITLRSGQNQARTAAVARFLLSGLITVCMVLYFSFILWSLHMRAAQCQWALVMFFLIFLGTFAIEFRHNHFYVVCVEDGGRETVSEMSMHHQDQV